MTIYPTTFLVSDSQGRPSVKTDNVNKVIVLLEQGWSATRSLFGADVPVTLDTLTWAPEDVMRPRTIAPRHTIAGRIDARLGLGTRD